ncbi:hypothetical protein O0L34_g8729 [Tuta absoluta]|nr:hypothetical protein O0L34_g8729 [Tuta absoluta]
MFQNISALKLNPDLNNDVLCRSKSLDKKIPAISRLVRFIPDYVAKDPCVLLYGQRILRGITRNFTTSWIDEHTISATVQIPEGGHRILACPETVLKSKVDWLKTTSYLTLHFGTILPRTKKSLP